MPRAPGPCGGQCLHGSHVVFWQKWDFQDFGVGEDGLVAGGGHGLPRDAVDLVEGMWPQQTVVRRPDEQLQRERLALQVAVELAREQNPAQHRAQAAQTQLNFHQQRPIQRKRQQVLGVSLSHLAPCFSVTMKPGAWKGLFTPRSGGRW